MADCAREKFIFLEQIISTENDKASELNELIKKETEYSEIPNLQEEKKTSTKNHIVREIGINFILFDWGEGNEYWLDL